MSLKPSCGIPIDEEMLGPRTNNLYRLVWRHFENDEQKYQARDGCTHETIVHCTTDDYHDIEKHNENLPDERLCPACGGLLVFDEEHLIEIPEGTAYPIGEERVWPS